MPPKKKKRVPIPEDLSDEILYLSDRTCCKCHIPKKPIQLHHIDEDPSNNNSQNLAVLCLECHDETQASGGFGRKLTAGQVRLYRDAWLQEVRERRAYNVAQTIPPVVLQADTPTDVVRQYEEVMREVKKGEAERLLLQAENFTASLREKNVLVNQAVSTYPPFRPRELRQLGIDMSAAVIGNVDYLQEKSMQAMRNYYETLLIPPQLESDDRMFYIEHAIRYLEETALPTADDAVGLVYLACMYGCTQRNDDMMLVLSKACQTKPIVQVMKDEYRVWPMLFMLVDAWCSDPNKIERLRETLDLPQPTEHYFCTYMIQEYPQNPKSHTSYSEWVAVRKPEAPGEKEMGSVVLKISAPYPPEETTYAFFLYHNGATETIVPADKRVPVEDLYMRLRDLCILFCPLD
ncbi:MAG TPA: HNH endonuclease signature motif containing protein [Ktedonobacterales bacterium]|jgi:hypothetical protein